MSLDLQSLAGLLEQGPTPLFATVSGAHLHGFDSKDSDVDLRGAFVLPLGDVLGLREPKSTFQIMEVRDGIELDWVAHDVKKFVTLMTRRSGEILEQLYSPLVVKGGPWLDELRELGRGCLVSQLFYHYRGFGGRMVEDLKRPGATVKSLLYVFRILMTGIHVLRCGKIQADLRILMGDYPVADLDTLRQRKTEGSEKQELSLDEVLRWMPEVIRLETELQAAFEATELPNEPTTFEALEDYVVRARLALGVSSPRDG